MIKKEKPTLYIFSGLPASGKSSLAKLLAKKLEASYIRIDTIEQGLRDICQIETLEGQGYRLSYLIARDNLTCGNDVIADSVNPWDLTRKEWMEVAAAAKARYVNIEVVCSDKNEHRKRVEERKPEIKGLKLPTWEEVVNRDYHAWTTDRIVIDTAAKSLDDTFSELISMLEKLT